MMSSNALVAQSIEHRFPKAFWRKPENRNFLNNTRDLVSILDVVQFSLFTTLYSMFSVLPVVTDNRVFSVRAPLH
jgi:hypothetical protein